MFSLIDSLFYYLKIPVITLRGCAIKRRTFSLAVELSLITG